MATSEATELLLLPLDPLRGLRRISEDFDRLVELDPKLREAKAQVEQHLGGLPSEEDIGERLGPILWVQLRDHLKSQRAVNTLRRALGDGDNVLRSVEEALATTFDVEVLQEVIREAGQLAQADSAAAGLFRQARDELNEGVRPKTILKKILIVIIIILILIIVAEILYILL
jgi:hypothetical protein